MSWGWWKAISAQHPFGFIWNASIHSWSFEMTFDGEVPLHGYAVKRDVAPSNTIKNPKILSSIFADPWSFFCTKSAHARSFNSWLCCITEWTCFHRVLIEVINSSRNIPMSDSLLELRDGHMTVFQVNVLQVTLVRQLVDNVLVYFTFFLFAQNRGLLCSLVRVPWHLLFQYSNGIPTILVVPFFVAVWSEEVSKVSEESEVQDSSSMAWSRPSSCDSFLVAGRTRRLSSSSSSSCMSSAWAGYAAFRSDMTKITCLFGWPDRSLDLVEGWYVRLVRSNTLCPIVEYSAGNENKAKAGHVILSPWGSKSFPNFSPEEAKTK